MAEAVKGTRRTYSVGDLFLHVQPLTKVRDSSTHASALGTIIGYWNNCTDEATSSTKAGIDATPNTVGTFYFRITPGVGADEYRNVDLYILTTELE